MLEERTAHDLCQLAIGVATVSIHLPQAVLGGDVALRDEEIFLRGGFDVGNAVGLAADDDGRREPGKMQIAVQLRECGLGDGLQPEHAGSASQQ